MVARLQSAVVVAVSGRVDSQRLPTDTSGWCLRRPMCRTRYTSPLRHGPDSWSVRPVSTATDVPDARHESPTARTGLVVGTSITCRFTLTLLPKRRDQSDPLIVAVEDWSNGLRLISTPGSAGSISKPQTPMYRQAPAPHGHSDERPVQMRMIRILAINLLMIPVRSPH